MIFFFIIYQAVLIVHPVKGRGEMKQRTVRFLVGWFYFVKKD
jgi:hypothetical protein